MPTYKARSVSATLLVSKLDGTLSSESEVQRKTENSQHAKYLQGILADGDPLYEHPVGPDGSEKGVARFIGEFEDMAMFCVECGEHNIPIKETFRIMRTIENPLPPTGVPGLANGDSFADTASSPLTSIANTPSLGTPENSFLQDSKAAAVVASPRHDSSFPGPPKEKTPFAPESNLLPGFEKQKHYRTPFAESQAISLEVEVGSNTCPPKQDIKVEIFFNGTPIDTDFVNTKRYTLASHSHKMHFHGNRLHVQIKKPWIYHAGDRVTESQFTAEERWATVAAALAQDAESRGHDAKGRPAPSAEYLNALSAVPFPERLKEKPQSSIIDVVVTTGNGRKFAGLNNPYVTGPLRMSSSTHGKWKQSFVQENPFAEEITQKQDSSPKDVVMEDAPAPEEAPTDPESSDPAPPIPSTSPDIPLARRTRSFLAPHEEAPKPPPPSPPKQEPEPTAPAQADTPDVKRTDNQKKVDLLAEELGLSPHKSKIIRSFTTRKGKVGIQRSINDRLSDILRMRPDNQEKAKQDLLAKLASEGLSLTKTTTAGESGLSPHKRQKPDTRASSSSSSIRRNRSVANQGLPNTADVMMPDVSDDPVAALAQARMDTAMDLGAAPDCRLAKRIESLSPHRTPVKRLGATPWASPGDEKKAQEQGLEEITLRNTSASPTKLRRGRSRLTAEASDVSDLVLNKSDEPVVQPPSLPANSKANTITGGNGSKSAGPKKQAGFPPVAGPTQEEAIEAFEVPKICEGGAITYAGPDQLRSAVKMRPGEFNELEFVVGMRFIVL